MATRMYLTNVAGDDHVTPPSFTGLARLLSETKAHPVDLQSHPDNTSSNTTVDLAYFVSRPVGEAVTLSGSLSLCIYLGGLTDVDYQLVAIAEDAVSLSGGTTVGSNTTAAKTSTYGTGYSPAGGVPLNGTVQAGQRIVFRLRQFGRGSTRMAWGGDGDTDLFVGDDNPMNHPAWVEFPQTLNFNQNSGGFFF